MQTRSVLPIGLLPHLQSSVYQALMFCKITAAAICDDETQLQIAMTPGSLTEQMPGFRHPKPHKVHHKHLWTSMLSSVRVSDIAAMHFQLRKAMTLLNT